MIDLVPLETIAPDTIERLLDRAFGADRHGRTAYRLREGVGALAHLSLAAVDGGACIGSIQCWPVDHVDARGTRTPMVLVGPVAVEPDRQQDGIGRALVGASLVAAAARDLDGALMLIGDPEYYGRFFGFTAERTAAWMLPGPIERRRLLARGAAVPGAPGTIMPRLTVAA